MVCLDDAVRPDGGVACPEAHFVCSTCLDRHVASCANPENQRLLQQFGGVWCVARGDKCSHIYSNQTIACQVEPATFNDYFAAKAKIEEARINRELQDGFELRLKKEAERLAAMNAEQRQLNAAKKHILENILQLACPRCGQVIPCF